VALASPELRLVGVTCVARIARRRAATAARLLGLAGRTHVPVFVGEDEAVLRKERFVWREIEDQGLPDGPDAPIAPGPAPAAIARLAREVPELELVAIGPLTNVARALAPLRIKATGERNIAYLARWDDLAGGGFDNG